MSKFLWMALLTAMLVIRTGLFAQNVNVSATGGVAFASYPTLTAAFNAINIATHTGTITVTVVNNTTEGAFGAILRFSGYQLQTNYDRIVITTSGNYTISGAPASTMAVIQLDGADNVTLNGTVNNGTGGTRNLTILNTSVNNTNTGVIWLKSSGVNLGCNKDSIMNVNIIGSSNSVSSSFGVFAGGGVISTTGAGADNDSIVMLNDSISRAFYGVYARGTTQGPDDNWNFSRNVIGSDVPAAYVTYRGMDLQYMVNGLFERNHIYNLKQSQNIHITGIEMGTGCSNNTVSRNYIHSFLNSSSGYYGAYGVNVWGTGNTVLNNQITDIRAGSSSITSLAFNAIGIRINDGNNHRILYNSVNLYDTIPVASPSAGMSACLALNAFNSTGLDIRNNIFSNKTVGRTLNSRAYCIFVPSGFSFSGSTINRNAYFLPASNNPTTTYFVGTNMSGTYTLLQDWRGFSQQDANSLPTTHLAAPFVSNLDLHITGSPVVVESGGQNVTGITVDYDGEKRAGNAGYNQVPAGAAPDIGMDEFGSVPPDMNGPTIGLLTIAPAVNACNSGPHQVTAIFGDSSGIDSAMIIWTLNGVSQSNINMPFNGSNWAGVIPDNGNGYVTWYVRAVDGSYNHNVTTSSVRSYQDEYLVVQAGADQSICPGDTAYLNTVIRLGTALKISEVMQFRQGTGVTPNLPAWATGEDLVEIVNTGIVPIDISGYQFQVSGGATANFVFPPNTVFPDSAVLIIHVGTGTDIPGNLYFNTQTFDNDLTSGEPAGFVLKTSGGRVVDAVATNNYVFTTPSGVTASDWTGTIPSSFGRAGVIRNAGDSNNANDWSVSDTNNVQSVGVINPGAVYNTAFTYYWTPGGYTQSVVPVSPGSSTQYVLTVTDGNCTVTDTMNVNVISPSAAPLISSDTVCGLDTLILHGTARYVLNWYPDAISGSVLHIGDTFAVVLTQTDTFWVEDYNGACNSPRTAVVAVVQPADPIVVQAPSTVCNQAPAVMSVSSSNANYRYTWTGSNLVNPLGDTVQAYPGSPSWYHVSAWDGFCRNADSVLVNVNPLPVSSITASDTLICIDDSVTLNSSFYLPYSETRAFSDSVQVSIPDANPATGAVSQITVSGILEQQMTDSSVVFVRLNITHPRDGHLTAWLYSPSGDSIRLFSGVGANAPNFSQTYFSPAGQTSIVSGIPPYTGTWYPQGPGDFTRFTGSNPNGTWRLRVTDNNPGFTGTLDNWTISLHDYHPGILSWYSNPAGLTDSLARIVVHPARTTQYVLNVRDSVTGCAAERTVTIHVRDSLQVTPVAPIGICQGGSDTLFAFATGGDGNYSFVWANGVSNSDTAIVNLPNDSTFYVSVTDGCGTPADSDSVFVPVALPVSIVAQNDTVICQGSLTTITTVTSGGDGNFVYDWNLGPVNTPNIDVTLSAAQTYQVLVVDGCGTRDSDSVFVDVFPLPSVQGPNDTAVCEGSAVTFTATGSGGHGALLPLWTPTLDSSWTTTDTLFTPVTYVISATDACNLTARDTFAVNVNPLPVAAFNYTFGANGQVQFTNSSQFAVSQSWAFGDGANSTGVSPSHTYIQSGNYTVRLIVTNNCGSDTAYQTVNVVITGASEASAGTEGIRVFPNPNEGRFTIILDGSGTGEVSLQVLTVSGVKVWEYRAEHAGSHAEIAADLSGLAAGVYFLEVRQDGTKSRCKVVVR